MKISDVWRDPVVSSVLATGISGLIWPAILGNASEAGALKAWLDFLGEASTPNWQFVLAASSAIGVAVYAAQKWRESRGRACLSSKEWFSLVEQKLNDCTSARIYLRRFDHPDNFRDEHREVLMKMMKTIKARVAAGADIRIISYNDNGDKTGLEWLASELNGIAAVKNHVKIVATQPATNTSSMYLFDDKSIVFNRRLGKSTQYYLESHAGSILFEFAKEGFEGYWSRV